MNAYTDTEPARLVLKTPFCHKGLAIVDIDDVLAEFPPVFMDYIEKRTRKPLEFGESQYGLEDAVINGYPNGSELLDDFYNSHEMMKLPPIKGGLEFIRLMKNLGFHLVALTGRPGGTFQNVIKDTVLWLSNNGFDFDEVCFSRRKGEFIHKHYAVAGGLGHSGILKVGIEDNLKNAKEMAQHCHQVYFRRKPHGPAGNQANVFPFWQFEDAASHLIDKVIEFNTL